VSGGQEDLLKRITHGLDEAGISYMLAGSIGSSLHGHPRATRDIDVVIDPSEEELYGFVESLGDEYYVSVMAARDAFSRKSAFNIVDNVTGWKVDVVIRKDRAFSREEFGRRRKASVMGQEVYVASAEDVILSKLEWAKGSESEQQYRDALGIVEVQCKTLDLAYLHKWAEELGVGESLEALLRQSNRAGGAGKGGEV